MRNCVGAGCNQCPLVKASFSTTQTIIATTVAFLATAVTLFALAAQPFKTHLAARSCGSRWL
jgi:hypothetical protein